MTITPTRPDARTRLRPSRVPTRRTVAHSWAEMPWSLRILRAFLGVTFVYAGMQKFLDRGFLQAGSPTYIGTQLRGFAVGTPAAPLMRLLEHAPLLVGIGVALTEIVVGIAVLTGVGLVFAALVGFSINVVLWLSATWHVRPYFIGSDSIYAVAWLALMAGIGELERQRTRARPRSIAQRLGTVDRRQVLRGAAVAGGALVLAAVTNVFASPLTTSSDSAAGAGLGGGGGDGPVRSTRPSPSAPSTLPSTPTAPAGKTIATLDRLPVGKAIGFTAPGIGPAALVRLADGTVAAYSRVCTHAGCLVGYDPQAQLLVCPCHGAEFDPSQHAQPVPGSPTSTPLQVIRVVVDKATGDVILPS
jgi:thiosulfate dehydrogenase [quinone] large subunit